MPRFWVEEIAISRADKVSDDLAVKLGIAKDCKLQQTEAKNKRLYMQQKALKRPKSQHLVQSMLHMILLFGTGVSRVG